MFYSEESVLEIPSENLYSQQKMCLLKAFYLISFNVTTLIRVSYEGFKK